jgi:hypothetical protein
MVFILLVTDANRARRRRRQTILNAGQQSNPNSQPEARQQPLPQSFPGQQQQRQQQQQQQQQQPQQPQQMSPGGQGMSKEMNLGQGQAGRQYYPYQGSQYGIGAQGGQYGIGAQGGQYGVGLPQYGIAAQGGQYGIGAQGYSPYGGAGTQYAAGQCK